MNIRNAHKLITSFTPKTGRSIASNLLSQQSDIPERYEKELVAYEFEIRNNVKVQHQLKLHVDLLKDKVEILERDLKKS